MFGRFALAVLGLLMLLSPMGTAQQPYYRQLLVNADGVEVLSEPGQDRLMPGETGRAFFRYSVHVPPLAVCPGPIEMTYKARLADGQGTYGVAAVAPSTETRSWGQPVQDLGAAPAGASVDGFQTELRFTLADDVPAFLDLIVEVWAWARPVSPVPGCTLAESLPVMQAVMFKADYVPRIELQVGDDPYLPEGIVFRVSNAGNGPTVVDIQWMTPTSWRASAARPMLESRVAHGERAFDSTDVVLNWAESPEDWDGRIHLIASHTPFADSDLLLDEAMLAFDRGQRPADYITDEAAPDESLEGAAALPGAGLWGAICALGLVAARRRRA